MVEFKGASSSTSKNLAREIIAVLGKYEIALTQIVSITSDNGAIKINLKIKLRDLKLQIILQDGADSLPHLKSLIWGPSCDAFDKVSKIAF